MRTGESALKLRGNIASKTRFIVFLARKDCNAMSPRLVHFSHTLLDILDTFSPSPVT